MSRYTPPSDQDHHGSHRHRRPRWVRIGVWVLLFGVFALVFADIFAAFI